MIPPEHKHQPEFESFTFTSDKTFSRDCFERFADSLPANVYRAKGFVRFEDSSQLFNFVAGRWDLEPFESAETAAGFHRQRNCCAKISDSSTRSIMQRERETPKSVESSEVRTLERQH